MLVKKYDKKNKTIWNEFLGLSKCEHFIFNRDFMDYHSDRFVDFSLMIYGTNGKLLALLPASKENDILFSHQGLTFGGLIIKNTAKQHEILEVFQCIRIFLLANNINTIIYKKIPYIYYDTPADEDLYALFRLEAKLIRRDVSSAIKLTNQIKYSKGRNWIIKKNKEENIEFKETQDLNLFWDTLKYVLYSNHKVNPTHSFEEIIKLKNLFPRHIKFFSAKKDGKLLSGVVIFETNNVAHTQYMFNTVEGRQFGALDGLVDFLVKDIYRTKDFFDFGISNENQGLFLNEGLIAQKEGFGARAIVHDFYEIQM